MRQLRQYQEDAVQKYDGCDGSAFIMQMRLGKTLTCIRWLERKTPKLKAKLIIAPKTVCIAWEDELTQEGLPFESLLKYTVADRKAIMDKPHPIYYLVNYETISRLDPKADKHILNGFDAVVLDESTCIKNPNAKATKFLLKAAPNIQNRSILSGIPDPEGWANIWPQMAFANGGTWMGFDNFYEWRESYFHNFGFEWVLPAKSETIIKKTFQDEAFVMTRTQAGIRDVKIRQKRVGTLSAEQAKIYRHILEYWELPGEESARVEDIDDSKYAMVITSWLRRLTGGVVSTNPLQFIDCWKFDELIHILTEEIPHDPVVVWFAFNADLSRAYQRAIGSGISATWITGEVEQSDRAERIRGFARGESRVMFIQQACGKFGIDLSAADTAIYFSSHYSYELRAQSEERIYRVGKANDNLIIDLVTEGTIDEDVIESIKAKKSDASILLSKYKAPTRLLDQR